MPKNSPNIQAQINAKVLKAYSRMNAYIGSPDVKLESSKQLRSCRAEIRQIYSKKDGKFLGTILRSYKTLIAFYDAQENETYDFLRYAYCFTSTSAQHFSKFWHDYGFNSTVYRYCPICTY